MGFAFKEPFKGYEASFDEIPTDKLEIVPYQRKPSKAHISNLSRSISKFGFVVPLVVAKKDENTYIVLDGQHRYLASLELGITKIPCIVVPSELTTLMLTLNVEKQPTIKEKAYVSLRVYQALLEESPEKMETDPDILESVEEIYFVTLGLVYDRKDRFAGSAYESIMKKADFALDIPLEDGWKERGRRADVIYEIDSIVTDIVAQLKDMGRWHPFIYKEVVSYVNPIKRKKLVVDFDEIFGKMKKSLLALSEDPSPVLKAVTEEGEF